MTKQKKRGEANQAPAMLLWETAFEFRSPLSLDECASRIQDINSSKRSPRARRKVFLSSVEENKLLFHLSQPGTRGSGGWAVGYLEGLSEGSTLITGKAGMSPDAIFTIPIMVVATIIFGLTAGFEPLFACFFFGAALLGLMVAVFYIEIRSTRSNLINTIMRIAEVDGD